jgi:ribosomal protein S27AE
VDLYERSGEPYQEKTLNALIHLCDVEPETWCLERLSTLAGRFQQYEIQAKAFEKLEKGCEAAEAFLAAAELAEQKNPTDTATILRLYEQSAKYFDREGMIVKYQKCYSKVIFYKKLPWILVGGKTEKAFRELEYNTLFLFVKNVGYGRADDINIHVIGDNFKVDEYSLPEPIKALAVSAERRIELSICPNKGQIGEDVRFVLEWSWKDKNHVEYQDRTTVKVVVKSQNDSKPGGTPVIINAENVTYVDGEYVHREILGDNIEAGGKKETGDKVEINHEGYSRVIDSGGEGVDISITMRKCPKCGVINNHAFGYCDKCGSKLE